MSERQRNAVCFCIVMWSFFSRDPSKDFPYDVGEPVPGLEDKSVWSLHKGKKKVLIYCCHVCHKICNSKQSRVIAS